MQVASQKAKGKENAKTVQSQMSFKFQVFSSLFVFASQVW